MNDDDKRCLCVVVMLGSGLFEEKINSLNEGPFVS